MYVHNMYIIHLGLFVDLSNALFGLSCIVAFLPCTVAAWPGPFFSVCLSLSPYLPGTLPVREEQKLSSAPSIDPTAAATAKEY